MEKTREENETKFQKIKEMEIKINEIEKEN